MGDGKDEHLLIRSASPLVDTVCRRRYVSVQERISTLSGTVTRLYCNLSVVFLVCVSMRRHNAKRCLSVYLLLYTDA